MFTINRQTELIKLGVFLLISIFLLSFDVYKSANASFTWDESYTYTHYINSDYYDILTYKYTEEANNHILNTILSKFSASIGEPNEFYLRLPNILAHILYLFCIYKLIKNFSLIYFVSAIILLNFNPYLLDFFQLSRGYGLGISFSIAAIYNYTRYIEFRQTKFHIISNCFLILACLSNFTFITLFLVFALIHNLFEFYIEKEKINFRNFIKINSVIIFFSFLCGLLIYLPLKKLVTNNKLTEGGTEGFWQETINSLLHSIAYERPYEEYLTALFKVLIIVFTILFIHYSFAQKQEKSPERKKNLVVGWIILLLFITIEAQHYILGTNYLKTRFALFLYPIFMLMVCFSCSAEAGGFIKIKRVLLIFLAGIMLTHTIASLNTKWYYEWKYMSVLDAKTILLKINTTKNETSSISFGCSWIYHPVLEYYRQTQKLSKIKEIDWGYNLDNNYFILNQEDLDSIKIKDIEILEYYPTTRNYLVKHNVKKSKRITFRAFNNNFVCTDANLDNVIIADRVKADKWETFYLKEENNIYFIQAHNFKFLTIDTNTLNSELKAKADDLTDLEKFVLIQHNTAQFSLIASNGKYVSVNKATNKLQANSDSITSCEIFKWN